MKKLVSLLLAIILLMGLMPVHAEEETDLSSFILRYGRRDEKKVAITVDDSWDLEYTWKIRDLFHELGVVGTFFPIGMKVLEEDGPEWQKILDYGNEIGSHSFGHLALGAKDPYNIYSTLARFQQALDAALGYHYQVNSFRPPYGSIKDESGDGRSFRTAVQRYGYQHIVLWEVSQTEVNKAFSKTKNGSILLFHARHKDYVCLQELIPRLLEAGYELVTVSDLLEFGENEISPEPYVFHKEDYQKAG